MSKLCQFLTQICPKELNFSKITKYKTKVCVFKMQKSLYFAIFHDLNVKFNIK